MAMQAETLEVLEKSNVPSHQARAIARAIEIEIAASQQTLATRADIKDLRGEMQAMKSDLLITLQKSISEQTRWMFAGFVTIIMMMIGYIFVNDLVK